MRGLLEWIFWVSVAFVVAVTVGYPIMITVLNWFIKRTRVFIDDAPMISLIIAAHNEEKVIKKKLENSLELDYPRENLEIVVASDGSTDRTNEIVNSFSDREIKLYAFNRLGKTGIQNESVRRANGEILVFSDANAFYKQDAIRKLIRNFGDDQVGCVSGQLVYKRKDKCVAVGSESCYWNYEKYLKSKESALSSLIGVNGSIYAIRKRDYVEIDNRLISDFVEPLEIVKRGKRVVYEPEAISEEEPSVSYDKEFKRKVRIQTRSIQGVFHMRCLLNPFRYGIFSIQLLVHKAFRYLIPIFLLAGALSLGFLTHKPFYFMLFCFMIISLFMAAIAKFAENRLNKGRLLKIFNLIYYYLVVNYALVLAWVNVLKGRQILVWSTERDHISH